MMNFDGKKMIKGIYRRERVNQFPSTRFQLVEKPLYENNGG
jgi:hypothetical protein